MSSKKETKPARLQVDLATISADDKPPQTGNVFNIWFLKWSGGDSSTRNYSKLKFRVNIKKDEGITKAKAGAPICIFFARGCCYLGKKCPYFHKLPTDEDYFLPTQDCFGRDKTADYRDDMDGVGSLNRRNRTLYVAGLHISPKMDYILTKHFGEFGSIDKIRVLPNKACAFITYRLESEAQFAKEAMQSQSLDDNEILIVRWANTDPNPEAQREEKQRQEEIALETVGNLLDEINYHSSNNKRKPSGATEEHENRFKDNVSKADVKRIKVKETVSGNRMNSFFTNSSLRKLKQLNQGAKEPSRQIYEDKANDTIKKVLEYSSDEDL